YPGSVAGIGWTVNMSSTIGQAFQVGQAVIMAARYAGEMNGSNLSNVNVSYPNTYGSSNCCYLSSTKTIYLDYVTSSNNAYPNSYASWDAILHEYGHHVQHEFNISNSPGGQHSIGANLADIHGKQSGIRLAWGEAFPTTFSMMVQDYYLVQTQNIYTFGDTSYTAFNGVDEPVENINSQYKSEANEAAIFGLLWDLYDNSSNETFDTISMSHNTFWNIITGSSATTFSAFANCYYSLLTFSERLQFGELLSYYGMAASDLYAYGFDNTPMFNWTRNGTTSTMQNNNFTLMLYNLSGVQLFSKTNINAAQVLLSANEWNQVLSTGYTDLIAVLIAYQTNTPLTGGYISQPLYCDIS
ncbi:MAG: hypothetical protein K5925_03940, partial [Bacilli bacterium]|nr:hypothetical protein [Bacilli bacterium]